MLSIPKLSSSARLPLGSSLRSTSPTSRLAPACTLLATLTSHSLASVSSSDKPTPVRTEITRSSSPWPSLAVTDASCKDSSTARSQGASASRSAVSIASAKATCTSSDTASVVIRNPRSSSSRSSSQDVSSSWQIARGSTARSAAFPIVRRGTSSTANCSLASMSEVPIRSSSG